MPELPEVETTRHGLAQVLEGAVITRVEIRRRDLRWPIPADLESNLTGARIEKLGRRAKYILVYLDNGGVWLIHLGMSGRMIVERSGDNKESRQNEPHVHVLIETEAGDIVLYQDHRRFGSMDWTGVDDLGEHPRLKTLGVEPLSDDLSGRALKAMFEKRSTPLKAALLDQRRIAGLGNIYVCEALNRSKLSPFRKAGALKVAEADALADAVKQTLAEAIAAGGSSLRDYVQTDGELGYFQNAWRVYGKEGERCSCGSTRPIERAVQSGRSTFYCPACQA